MSWGVSPWVYPVWNSLVFLDLGDYFLPHFREVVNYYLLKYFLVVFLFVFFFGDSYDLNIGVFNIAPEVSEIVLISFNSFFFFPLLFIYFYHSIFYLTKPTFCLHYSTICSLQSVFNITYCIIHYILTLFLFILGPCQPFLESSQSLFPSYLSVTSFCFQDFGSLSLSLFWILYQIDLFLFCLVRWAFILFLYLLSISLSLHLDVIALFGVAFLYSASL